jgi:hypothetical protein
MDSLVVIRGERSGRICGRRIVAHPNAEGRQIVSQKDSQTCRQT